MSAVIKSLRSMETHGVWWMAAGWLWFDLPALAWIMGSNPVELWSLSPLAFISLPPPWLPLLVALWYVIGAAAVIGGFWGVTKNPSSSKLRTAGVLVALLATVSLPFASHDMFAYFGEIVSTGVYHVNPMTTPISDIPAWWANPWLARAGWQTTVNPYGPIWYVLIKACGTLSFTEFFWIWKTVCLLSVLVLAALIERIHRGRGWEFVLHPAVGIELMANGHNDVLMLLFMGGGYWLWTQKRWVLSGLAMGVSFGVKYVSVILFPVLALAGMGGAAVLWGLAVLFPFAAGLLPFWSGPGTLGAPLHNTHLFLRSPAWIIQGVLVHLAHWPRDLAQRVAGRAGLAGWIAVYVPLGFQYLRTRRVIWLGDVMMALAVLGMSWMQYWYLTWALPFYCLSTAPRSRSMIMAIALAEIIRSLGMSFGGNMPVIVQLAEVMALWGLLGWGVKARFDAAHAARVHGMEPDLAGS